MTARRSKIFVSRRTSKVNRSKRLGLKWKTILIIFLFLGFFFYLSFNTKYWTGNNKLNIASPLNGSLALYIFDPVAGKIITLTIPGDTELESARNLGVFRAKNLWQLSINEKAQGVLVGETITRNFNIPTIAWAEKPIAGFASGRGLAQLKALVTPFKTNLSFADKLRLFFFGLGVSEFKVENVNLAESGLLINAKLIDGGEGYKVTSRIPDQVLVLASDYYFTHSQTVINIIDASGDVRVIEDFTRVVEAMGAKVVKIEKTQDAEMKCEVSGKDERKVQRVAMTFGCKSLGNNGFNGNFDLQIKLGEGFAKSF